VVPLPEVPLLMAHLLVAHLLVAPLPEVLLLQMAVPPLEVLLSYQPQQVLPRPVMHVAAVPLQEVDTVAADRQEVAADRQQVAGRVAAGPRLLHP
jgi:hypothetical protein